MALLPRYQRIGLQVRQPQQMDFAAAREQARLGQTISQQVDRMSEFAFREAAQAAELRGQERVREEGARPTLEAIEEAGGPTTIAERAAYALGSRVAVAEIQNEAEVEIMRILNDAERNETPFTTVQARLADVKDGYSASLDTIDPEAALILQTNLSSSTLKAEERYSNYYVKLQAARAAEKVNDSIDVQYERILKNAILPGYNEKTIKSDIDASIDLLAGLGASDAKLDAFKEAAFNAAIKENTIYKFNTSDLDTQAEMLTGMETKPVPGMSLEQTQSLRKSLRADYNSKIQVTKGEAAAIISDVNEQKRILALGGMPSEKEVQTLMQRADATGDFGAGARDAVSRLQFDMEKASTFRKMTPEDLAAEVQALNQGLEGMGEAGIDTLIEAETLKVAQAYLTSAQEGLKKAEDIRKEQYKPIVESISNKIENFQKVVDSGRTLETSDITELMKEISEVPQDLRGDIPEDILALEITSETVEALVKMTPPEAAGYLRSLYSGVFGMGGPGLDTPVEIQTYDLAKKMLTGMETELAKDPLSYAMRVGLKDVNGNNIEITPINFSDADATVETIKKRINDATIVSSKYLTPIKYFTPQEKSALVEVMNGSDRAQRLFILGSIVDAGGQAAPDMMAEISKTAPEFAGIGALVVNERMDVANTALRGMDAIQGGFKPVEFTPSKTDIPFNAKTTEALRYQPNAIGIVRAVATAIYADIARNEQEFSEDLWNTAIDLALGADGAGRGGIQEVRGVNTFIPPQLTVDQIEDALKAITPESIAVASDGQVLSEEYVEDISGRGIFSSDNNYKPVSVGGNNFILAYGDPSIGQPIYVFDKAGDLLVFDMQKLVEADNAVLPDTVQPKVTEVPISEIPTEASELKLQTDNLKKMLDTVPIEIQRATSLENRKLLNRYQKEVSEGVIDDSDFFLSYDDWLKGQ